MNEDHHERNAAEMIIGMFGIQPSQIMTKRTMKPCFRRMHAILSPHVVTSEKFKSNLVMFIYADRHGLAKSAAYFPLSCG